MLAKSLSKSSCIDTLYKGGCATAFIIREILILIVFAFVTAPLQILIKDQELAKSVFAGLYWFITLSRLGAHGLAYLLISWEMHDRPFIRAYATYLYRFHFIFRPLYYLCGAPVPYAEPINAPGSGQSQNDERSHNSGSSSYQGDYEQHETEQERYERRKRERGNYSNPNEGHESTYGQERAGSRNQNQQSQAGSDSTGGRSQGSNSTRGLDWMFTRLGLTIDCSYEEAERAYKHLAKEYHPDIHANSKEWVRKDAEKHMKEINEAWDAVKKLFDKVGKN